MGPSEADLDRGNLGDGQSICRVSEDDALGGYAVAIMSEAFRTDVRNQLTVQITSLPGARNSSKSTVRRDVYVWRDVAWAWFVRACCVTCARCVMFARAA